MFYEICFSLHVPSTLNVEDIRILLKTEQFFKNWIKRFELFSRSQKA